MKTLPPTPEQLAQLEAAFTELGDLDEQARTAYLSQLKIDDPELAQRLQALVVNHDTAQLIGTPINTPNTVDTWLAEGIVGKHLGRFKIKELIGIGGMGWVFRATSIDHVEQQVAIKVLKSDLAEIGALGRFQLESQALAKLDHPNVARLIEVSPPDAELQYVAMEFVAAAVPITAYCKQHDLAIDQRLTLFTTVCSAVDSAHRHLIIHRDIKPSNVLVDDDGNVKLVDFGIAKLISDEASSEQTNTANRFISGASAAPEQITGSEITVATDVYGLGGLLYELLCDCKAINTDDLPAKVLSQILEQAPKQPSAAGPPNSAMDQLSNDAKADLDAIALKALRKEPEARYRTVDRLVEDIQRFSDGLPVFARADSRAYVLRKFVRRNKWRLVSSGAVLFALLAVASQIWWQHQQTKLERDRAQQIAKFMLSTFATADPSSTGGEQTTAGELLLAGAKRLPEELSNQPTLQFELYVTFAKSMLALAMNKQAQQSLDRAQRLMPDISDTGFADEWHLLSAKIASSNSDMDQASDLVAKGFSADPDPATWLALSQLNCDLISRRDTEAEYGRCLTNLRESMDSAGVARSEQLHAELDWAAYLGQTGQPDQAIEFEQAILAEQNELLASNHPDKLRTLNRLTTHLTWMGRYEEATTTTRELVRISQSVYPEQSAALASSMVKHADSLGRQRNYVEAKASYENAIEIYERRYGPDHMSIARSAFNAGSTLGNDPDSLQDALRYLEQSVRIADLSGDAETRSRLLFRVPLGLLLNQSRDFDRARPVFAAALAVAGEDPELKKYDFYAMAAIGGLVAGYASDPTPEAEASIIEIANELHGVTPRTTEILERQLTIARELGAKLSGLAFSL